jgi:uncharacterized protein (TIGR03067 family)
MRLVPVLMILSTTLCWAADAKEEAVKKEMDRLQGTWKILKSSKEGRAKSEEELKRMQVVIAGDKLTVKESTGGETTTPFTIDPGKKPPTIDITLEKSKPTIYGIYELDKDTLKICFSLVGNKRPDKFVASENSGTGLLILQREKK